MRVRLALRRPRSSDAAMGSQIQSVRPVLKIARTTGLEQTPALLCRPAGKIPPGETGVLRQRNSIGRKSHEPAASGWVSAHRESGVIRRRQKLGGLTPCRSPSESHFASPCGYSRPFAVTVVRPPIGRTLLEWSLWLHAQNAIVAHVDNVEPSIFPCDAMWMTELNPSIALPFSEYRRHFAGL